MTLAHNADNFSFSDALGHVPPTANTVHPTSIQREAKILPPTLSSNPSVISQRPQKMPRFPSDGTVSAFFRPTINTPSDFVLYNICHRGMPTSPFSAPRFLSLSTNEHLGLGNSHVIPLLFLSLFPEEDLCRRPVYLHIQVSG